MILVVDDEERIRGLFKDGLENAGYTCLLASSGPEALEVLAQGRVDLALLDIIMPGMSGTELFLRMQQSHPDVPVVFVTAVADVELATDSLRAGAYDFVTKPMRFQQLEAVVERALERRRAVRAEEEGEERLRLMADAKRDEADRHSREVAALTRSLQEYSARQERLVEVAHRLALLAERSAQEMRRLADEAGRLAAGLPDGQGPPLPPA